MRFYGFGNYYLSSLQQGLQAGHAAVELHVKYNILDGHYDADFQKNMFNNWAMNHKTMVLLNGGNSADLQELFEFLSNDENPYPYVKFHEDEVSLNGALTYVGLILPPKIYDTSAAMRNRIEHCFDPSSDKLHIKSIGEGFDILDFSQYEYNLCERLNFYGLAK